MAGRPAISDEEPLRHDDEASENHRRQGRDLGLLVELLQALLHPGLEVVGPTTGLLGVEPGVGPAGLLLELEVLGPEVPVADLLGQALLHGSTGLADPLQATGADLGEVARDHLSDGVAEGLLLQLPRDPGRLRALEDGLDARLLGREWPVVEVGSVVKVASLPRRVHLDVEHLLRDGPPVAVLGDARVLDGVLQVKEDARRLAHVPLVHQYRPPAEQLTVAFQRQVERGVEQRVAGADEGRRHLALWSDLRLLKRDALVARQYWLADTDEPVPIPHRSRDVGDLEPLCFPQAGQCPRAA